MCGGAHPHRIGPVRHVVAVPDSQEGGGSQVGPSPILCAKG